MNQAKPRNKGVYLWKRGRLGERQMEVSEFNRHQNLRDVQGKIDELNPKPTYQQDWPAYNAAQSQEKIIAEKMLLEILDSFEEKKLKVRGRPQINLKGRIYSMFLYVYLGSSARRTSSDLKMAKQRGVIEEIPHYNSIFNFFSNTTITPILKQLIHITALPLKQIEKDFAIDSSGFSTSRFERWFNIRTQKYARKRHWKKCHLSVGVRSNVITAVKITAGHGADCPEFLSLAAETRRYFDMEEISADKAYLSRDNLNGAAELGCVPYIPFKSNSSRKQKGSVIWSKMFDYFLNNQEKFLKSYHKRSNVETTFSMIKRKYGNHLKTKLDESQVNEILMKCICHNLAVLVHESFELGIEIDLNSCVKQVLAQK